MKQCIHCGNEMGDFDTVCNNCGKSQMEMPTANAPVVKSINPVTGTVGALIGAVIGGASIILVSQLGYVAGICGFILAACTLKGYELLGGGMNTAGLILSAVLMLVTPYIADRLDWAIVLIGDIQEYYNETISLGDAWAMIPLLLEDSEFQADYWKNLGMIYLFTIIGGAGTLWKARKA